VGFFLCFPEVFLNTSYEAEKDYL